MLSSMLEPRTIAFSPVPLTWESAVKQAAQPLIDSASIELDYVDAMLASISNGGVYIDLGFGIALAHARPEAGVLKTGLSMLKLPETTNLADMPEHPIDLFFVLAAVDKTEHISTMSSLARLLSVKELRQALKDARTTEDVIAVVSKAEVKK